jgi:hypothetical protein
VISEPGFGVPAPRRRTIVLPGADGALGDSVPAIAGWEVAAESGRGAGWVTHHVRRDGGDYALTLLDARADPEPVLLALRREAARLAMVGHPGLPLPREVGVVGSRPYLVADLVPGRPLADLLAEGPLPLDAVRALAVDLAGVLAALHRRGLAHGEVTPEHVVVDPDGVAHLVDFGPAARPVGAPAADGRGDLDQLGALLLRCLAGRLPPGREELAAVVSRLLAEDPGDRYPTAHALLADLAGLAGLAGLPGPGAASWPPRQEDPDDLPLCGRDGELASLADRWRRARGGSGGVALISGAAGIGTSRLARELAAAVRSGRGILLRALAEPPSDPAGVVDSLVGLARSGGGLLLVLDDVHRLDPESLRTVGLLADRLADVPLLLLATARTDAAGVTAFRAAVGPRLDVDLTLGPLDVEGLAELIGAMLPGVGGRPSTPAGPAGRLARQLAEAGGSPFVARAYVGAAVDAGLLRPGRTGWELAESELAALALPEDPVGLILSRVDGIGGQARELLTTAAAAGEPFDSRLLTQAHALPEADVVAVLAEAHARRLLDRRADGSYVFAHDQVRESLLAGLAA